MASGYTENAVLLGTFSSVECDVVVAKLRIEGLRAVGQPHIGRYGVHLPTGNAVWVHRDDLDRARGLVALDPESQPPEPDAPGPVRAWLERHLGGTD